jgi:competence protein ComEA
VSGIWAPVVAKGALALVAVAVLAFVGARAGANPPVVASGAASMSAVPVATSAGVPAAAPAPSGVAPTPLVADGGAAVSSGVLPDGRVILNQADEDALKTLPGIGSKRAQAILALRQRLVRFRAVEDLRRVKGIGAKTLAKIKAKAVVNGPG